MDKTITQKYHWKVELYLLSNKLYINSEDKNEINITRTWKKGTKCVPNNFCWDTN